MKKNINNNTIALVGNPNSGKTTFFNALTGSNQHVGNWPGVTVEKKEGNFQHKGNKYHIVDLPGTYSLGAFSEDEVVAREYILSGEAKVIINVVDATNIERNLYLTTQLLEMEKKVVVALNMYDEAEKRDIHFDIDNLSQKLGVPVVPTVAAKGIGTPEVIEAAISLIDKDIAVTNPVHYSPEIWRHLGELEKILEGYSLDYPRSWVALKIVEGDAGLLRKLIDFGFDDATITKIEEFCIEHNCIDHQLDIVDARYAFAHHVADGTVIRPEEEKTTFTDRLDKVLTNRYLGIPIFAVIMLLIFQLTFKIGEEWMGGAVEFLIDTLGEFIEGLLVSLNTPDWFVSFIADGVFNGIGAVLEFIPVVTVLYFLLGLMEDSGYMSRAAYVWDDLMRRMGLQGKAFIPMIIGFGCSVPAIMAARTLDNKKDRLITTLIIPFMSCGAKLPIYSIFIAAFFSKHGGLILFGLYSLGIIIALILAKIFGRAIQKGETSYFLIDLPPYRRPIIKNVLRNMWDNVRGFIINAGTIIFVVITLLWVLAYLPTSAEPYSKDSFLGQIGVFIAPLFKLAGFGKWQESVALFAGIPAKEAVVGTLGMLYSGQYAEEGIELINALRMQFTSLSALSYMVMTLLYTPCAATLAIIKKETNSYLMTGFVALYTFVIGWVLAVAVYQVGLLLGFA